MYRLYCTVYIVQIILYSLYCTGYSEQFILYRLYCTVYFVQYILYSIYYTGYTVQYILYCLQSIYLNSFRLCLKCMNTNDLLKPYQIISSNNFSNNFSHNFSYDRIHLMVIMWKTMPGRVKQVPQDSTEWDRTDPGHSTDKHLHVWYGYWL